MKCCASTEKFTKFTGFLSNRTPRRHVYVFYLQMCEANVTHELENADKGRHNFVKCYLDGSQDGKKHPTFVLTWTEIWFQFCGHMTSQNNSFPTLTHKVSLRDALVLTWRAVRANRIDSPVNFCDKTFSPISLVKWPTWCTFTLYKTFIIIILYMFPATLCSSSGGQVVLIQHLV